MIRRKAVVVGLLLVLLTGAGRTQQPTAGRTTDPNLTAQQRAAYSKGENQFTGKIKKVTVAVK